MKRSHMIESCGHGCPKQVITIINVYNHHDLGSNPVEFTLIHLKITTSNLVGFTIIFTKRCNDSVILYTDHDNENQIHRL